MFECFFPNHEIDSAYDIDYEGLFNDGFRGLIYDIDNTLVPHGAPADLRAVELFERLKAIGYQVVLLSNNKEERVKMFNDSVRVQYIYRAGKPRTSGYETAMKMMGTDKTNTLFIGDQLFTDVWGAKKTGLDHYLVKPIHPREEIQIVIKRKLEKIVLHFYHKKLKKSN